MLSVMLMRSARMETDSSSSVAERMMMMMWGFMSSDVGLTLKE